MNKKKSKIQGGWAKSINTGNQFKNNQMQKSYEDSRLATSQSSTQNFTFEHVVSTYI